MRLLVAILLLGQTFCRDIIPKENVTKATSSNYIGKSRGTAQVDKSPIKSLTASSSAAAAAVASGDSSRNSETSSLAGIEFNTPYSHEIAVLACVLFLVTGVAAILAVKFTYRAPPEQLQLISAAEDDASDDFDNQIEVFDEEDEDRQEETVEPGATDADESAPIMHRFIFSKPSSNYSYESLLQTRRKSSGQAGRQNDGLNSVSSCRFSVRLDEANGLLCLHGFLVAVHFPGEHQQQQQQQLNLDNWTLAVDIVAQTDVECRQMRLQTKLIRRALADHVGWTSEPIEDVLAVRVKQKAGKSQPPQGCLLIRALALQEAEPAGTRQRQSEAAVSSMLALGGANFKLDRIRRTSMPNLEVTLRDKA